MLAHLKPLTNLLQPELAHLGAALLDHVDADPLDIVDADLVEGSFDEGAFEGVVEFVAVDVCRGVHCGDDGDLSQAVEAGDKMRAIHVVGDSREDDLVDETLHHCRGAHPPDREDHHYAFCPFKFLFVVQDQRVHIGLGDVS